MFPFLRLRSVGLKITNFVGLFLSWISILLLDVLIDFIVAVCVSFVVCAIKIIKRIPIRDNIKIIIWNLFFILFEIL